MAKKGTKKITSKGKPHNDNKFIKVGRIKYNSWATKALKARDILISEGAIEHISEKHKRELEKTGMSGLDFVIYVLSNFNEVRKGTGRSYLLVVKRENLSRIAAIELSFFQNKDYYIVKTALPMSNSYLNKKALLCANVHRH